MTISVSLGLWKPHVQAVVQRLNSLYPSCSLGTYAGHDPDRSLAVDLMIPGYKTVAGNALGWAVAKFIWANRVELGVWYVIFDGKIISQTRPSSGWIRYFDAGSSNDSKSHKNHVHVSFNSTPPRGWTEVPVSDVWLDRLVPGVKDSDSVRLVQKALEVPETGTYDEATVSAVKAFQASLGDAPEYQDGLLGRLQANALFTAKKLSVSIRTDPSGQAPRPPVVTPPVVVPPKPPVVKPPAVVPPKPTAPETPVSTATETVFGLNILRRTDTLAGRKRWPEREPLIGKILRDAKASVYLLIETDTQTRKDCGEALGNNFAYWGFKYYGVYWDQRVWERTGDATNEVQFRDKNNRWLLSIPLRHKATGKVVTFDCTHLENDGDTATDGHRARHAEATHLAEIAKSGRRVGFWDCNSTTPAVVSKPTARQLQKPRVILHTRIGARFLTSLGSKVKNLSKGTHHGGKGKTTGPVIDDAWLVGDIEFGAAEVVLTYSTRATDHNGLKFQIKF